MCNKTTQVWNDRLQKCECANGYSEKNGVCVADTICPPGFSLFKGTCYRVTRKSDTAATSATSSSAAVPTSGASTSATTTATASIPAQGSLISQQAQQTQQTQQTQQSQPSQQCQSPQIWNETTKSCQCPENSNFDDVNRRCVTCK